MSDRKKFETRHLRWGKEAEFRVLVIDFDGVQGGKYDFGPHEIHLLLQPHPWQLGLLPFGELGIMRWKLRCRSVRYALCLIWYR